MVIFSDQFFSLKLLFWRHRDFELLKVQWIGVQWLLSNQTGVRNLQLINNNNLGAVETLSGTRVRFLTGTNFFLSR